MKKESKKPRALLVTLILLCFAYFIGGALAIKLQWLTKETYLTFAGIVGGLASVVGLISLLRPSITKTDIKELEIESLKELTKATEELKKLERARSVAKEEIGSLETQKEQMEFLVRKASLSLFLKEQRNLYERNILKELDNDSELMTNLSELNNIDEKLQALNEEIESDPNVDLLKAVTQAAKSKVPATEEILNQIDSPILKTLIYMGKILRDMAKNLVSVYKID